MSVDKKSELKIRAIEKLKKYEQAHISKCLIKLKQAGVLKDRKEGLNVYYKIEMKCIKIFIKRIRYCR